MERAVVMLSGQSVSPDLLAPPGHAERRWKPIRARPGGDLQSLIQQLVRLGIQTYDNDLDERIVGGVERELIEQVLEQCGDVHVKAALRLGINRNTLHKKVEKYKGTAAEGDAP